VWAREIRRYLICGCLLYLSGRRNVPETLLALAGRRWLLSLFIPCRQKLGRSVADKRPLLFQTAGAWRHC
jgi:hypothetical protein